MIHLTILLAAEAAAEGGKGGLFDIDATLPIMAIQFLVLVALLNVLFYKPIGKAIDERDALVRGNLADARERLSKSEALAKQYEQELANARRATQKLIADAEADAQQIAAQQIAEAQKEAQVQREQAQQELDQQKQSALQSLEQQVDSLSQQILQKLLGTASVG
ncbi:F0F1 ATP synthase subunit B' [Phormidium tenue FACHB-886]|nr:F0F1 ATP synthase subunit B' [Phormidium tenue FACHB-886]